MKRSDRPEVRNPLFMLEGARRLRALPGKQRQALRALMLDIRRDAAARGEKSWRQRKAPMAAYWKAVSVYAGHIAAVLK